MAGSASLRVSAPSLDFHRADAGLFAQDMPRPVPLSRWDTEDAHHLHLGTRPPVRFAGFLSGQSSFTAKTGVTQEQRVKVERRAERFNEESWSALSIAGFSSALSLPNPLGHQGQIAKEICVLAYALQSTHYWARPQMKTPLFKRKSRGKEGGNSVSISGKKLSIPRWQDIALR